MAEDWMVVQVNDIGDNAELKEHVGVCCPVPRDVEIREMVG